MAIKVISDNLEELQVIKHIIDTGVLNVNSSVLQKNNLPTKFNVTYQYRPESPTNEQECSDDSCTPES